MSLIKLAGKRETRKLLKQIHKDNYDKRNFAERNAGKLLGLSLGAATAAITSKNPNDLFVGGGLGALVGRAFDNARTIKAFKAGGNFKKIK